MDENSETALYELDVVESITYTLLNHSLLLDACRWFAGIRRPSKTTLGLRKDLIDVSEKRKAITGD